MAERYVANILRAGAIISGICVFVGAIYYLVKYGVQLPHYHAFGGEPADLRSVPGIIRGALALQSRSIIQFGLLVLMLTPLAWVAFMFFVFLFQKDRAYTVITAIVLATLAFSLLGQ